VHGIIIVDESSSHFCEMIEVWTPDFPFFPIRAFLLISLS